MYGLQDVGGYDSQYLRRYVEFIKAIDRSGPPEPDSNVLAPSHFDSPLVDLLNVKYALTLNKVKVEGWELIVKEGMRIYQRSSPLSRAWIAAQAEVIGDDAAILDRLARPDFDPQQTVVLEQTPIEPPGETGSTSCGHRQHRIVREHAAGVERGDAARRLAGIERSVLSRLACDGRWCTGQSLSRELHSARRAADGWLRIASRCGSCRTVS